MRVLCIFCFWEFQTSSNHFGCFFFVGQKDLRYIFVGVVQMNGGVFFWWWIFTGLWILAFCKNPDPSKAAKFEKPDPCRFKPFQWRVHGCLGLKKNTWDLFSRFAFNKKLSISYTFWISRCDDAIGVEKLWIIACEDYCGGWACFFCSLMMLLGSERSRGFANLCELKMTKPLKLRLGWCLHWTKYLLPSHCREEKQTPVIDATKIWKMIFILTYCAYSSTACQTDLSYMYRSIYT